MEWKLPAVRRDYASSIMLKAATRLGSCPRVRVLRCCFRRQIGADKDVFLKGIYHPVDLLHAVPYFLDPVSEII